MTMKMDLRIFFGLAILSGPGPPQLTYWVSYGSISSRRVIRLCSVRNKKVDPSLRVVFWNHYIFRVEGLVIQVQYCRVIEIQVQWSVPNRPMRKRITWERTSLAGCRSLKTDSKIVAKFTNCSWIIYR